jgi:hypothetical protein
MKTNIVENLKAIIFISPTYKQRIACGSIFTGNIDFHISHTYYFNSVLISLYMKNTILSGRPLLMFDRLY